MRDTISEQLKQTNTQTLPEKAEPTPQTKTIGMAPEDNSQGYLWPHTNMDTHMSSLVTIDTQTYMYTLQIIGCSEILLLYPLFCAAFLAHLLIFNW